MTEDDKYEMVVLKTIIEHRNILLSNLPEKLEAVLGESHNMISNKAMLAGYWKTVMLNDKEVCAITKTGIKRYNGLKRKKLTDPFNSILFYLGTLSAVLGAVYAALTYHGCSQPKTPQSNKEVLHPQQTLALPPKTSQSDTTTDSSKAPSSPHR